MAIETPVVLPGTAQAGETTELTGEVLYRKGSSERVELVRGEIVYLSPTGRLHGRTEGNFYYVLSRYNREHGLGEVLVGETGVYTGRNPDTVRGMDVAFISHDRLARLSSEGFLDVAPELIVEIVSPGDRWSQVLGKLEEYFAIGVSLIWVADPSTRQIYVYRSLTDVSVLTLEDTLIGGSVLPDFSVPVAHSSSRLTRSEPGLAY